MRAEPAVEGHLVMRLGLEALAPFVVQPQGQPFQADPSAGRMQSRQSANGRPDARLSGPYRRISLDNISAHGRTRVARKIAIEIQSCPERRPDVPALRASQCHL